MQCEDMMALLQQHIDGEISAQDEALLQSHLQSCETCRALLCAYEQIDAGVAQLQEEPPENMAKGIMYRIAPERYGKKHGQKQRRFYFGGTAIAAAAAVLLLLFGSGKLTLPWSSKTSTAAEVTSAAVLDEADAEDNAELTDDSVLRAADDGVSESVENFGSSGIANRSGSVSATMASLTSVPIAVFYGCSTASIPELSDQTPYLSETGVTDLRAWLVDSLSADGTRLTKAASFIDAQAADCTYTIVAYDLSSTLFDSLRSGYGSQYSFDYLPSDPTDSTSSGVLVLVLAE